MTPLTTVEETCRCETRTPMDPTSHKAGCPVLKHFETDGKLKHGVQLTVLAGGSRTD